MESRALIIVVFAWIFCFPLATLSQLYPLDIKKADSLEKLFPDSHGKERVDILNSMSYALLRHYSNRSDSLADLAIDLSVRLNYAEGMAKALFCKGTNLYIQGEYIRSLSMLHDAVDLFKEQKDTLMIIETYYQLAGITYFSLTDMPEGLRLVKECLKYAIESGNKAMQAQMFSTLQYLWGTSGQADSALRYLDLYRIVAKEIPVRPLEAAMVEAAYGRCYVFQGDWRRAMNQFQLACRMTDPETFEGRAYLSQQYATNGNVYLKMGLPDSAFYYFAEGMELARKYRHYYGSMENSLGFARYYALLKNFELTKLHSDSAIFFCLKIDSARSFYGYKVYDKLLGMSGELYIPMNNGYKRFIAWNAMGQAYQMKINAFIAENNYKNAYEADRLFSRFRDSISGFQKQMGILDLQYKYQAEKKDNQITLLSQENQLQQFKINQNRLVMFSIAAVSVLLVLVLALFLRQNRIKADRRVTEFKQRLLRSQMNPHFIFNSLTSIQNFIVKQDDIRASVYLSRFSELVRSILKHSLVETITLEEELNTIENYLELQKVRYPDKFDYIIDIDPVIDIESVMVPPMLAQPFIENSIEHGIKHKEGKGRIEIRYKQDNDITIFEVEDDGVGRERSRYLLLQQGGDHKSLATVITRERIAALNRKSKKKITLEIIDLKDDEGNARGTLVRFVLPV
jgi:tetratricopeptide (TPR) repeat protein